MEEYKMLYMKENRLRKNIHNKLLELQGNIRVMCRARPVVEAELRAGQAVDVTEFPTPEDVIIRRFSTSILLCMLIHTHSLQG
jgi:kinesin family protein C2/C3